MGKRDDLTPRKRFSKSGHTSHQARSAPPSAPEPAYRPPPVDRPTRYDHAPRRPGPYDYDDPDAGYTERLPDPYQDRRPERRPGYGAPTYHRQPHDTRYADPRADPRADPYTERLRGQGGAPGVGPQSADSPTVGRAALSLGKATLSGTNRAARTVTRKVITASKSDGAEESGLTPLIWNQVLSYGTDAMITVALAGTVFFGASANAQRGNVLLYLLVTMAPFALVAPIIGPALDRLQHGRRWTMTGTAIGRAALALVMAAHPTELLVLYPCALGSLVLSKAYGVVRAAAAPRLVPPDMTLTEANAKLTVFGLGSTVVLGGFVGILIKVTGSYSLGLVVTGIAFAACGFFALRLPKQIDSSATAPRHPEEPIRPRRQEKVPPIARIQEWARRGFDPHIVIALQGESVLRLLSGMLTIYLAFYVESTSHGLTGVLELAGVVGAAGAGNFAGTAIGTRVTMAKPEVIIIGSTIVAGAVCILAALTFSVLVACIAMFVCSVSNALSKIGLDALIQYDVIETLRSSAFARSETFLQLAWVVGAAIAVALPSTESSDGTIAFMVAAVITGAVAVVVVLRHRATATAGPSSPRLGGFTPRSLD